ncbi:MAG: alpha/beta hydrolase [Oscillospiraceae bacterium]|nr:alpha/beta hydrolase [Oscillospiraceae bacterium]
MKRSEFLESCRDLNEAELLRIAIRSRSLAEKRVPEEMKSLFRSLDDVTEAIEIFVETAWGKTHVYVVKETGSAEKRPVLVNVHGGGWSLPHTERDVYFCRRMAVRTGCLVFDVDYVLAPEYPYPAALEELEALFDKLPELCEEYGGDANRVILCGQSAGGNLLGGVMWRQKTSLKPLAQILCYLPADNYNDHFHGEDLDERGMSTEYYGFFYNRNFEDRANHDVSLALSDVEELRGLPPTDILTGGLDNLKPEAERYLALLQEAGVPVTYRCFEKSRHGFLVNLYDEWQEGEDYVAGRIKEHLSHV